MKIVFMMKKRIAFSIILFLFSIISFAQKNSIKAGFITFGGTNYGVQYERILSNNISIIGQYGVVFAINSSYEATLLVGNGYYLEARYYFARDKDLLEGWHLGINFNYVNTNLESDLGNDYLKRSGIGFVGGYQWVFSNHITIDAFFGGGFMNTTTNLPSYHDGFFPLVGLNLGYNF